MKNNRNGEMIGYIDFISHFITIFCQIHTLYIIHLFPDLLTTETEIFLALVMKFLDPDKPSWQNGSALEVIHKIVIQPKLMAFICNEFDM